ncbi:MAG: hypothetical protein CLLPBCKN_001882 [Chroococcidiopsis cubana SAG 39.79]|nr:hypothetical protein [Chroococcidiopsis cubana SAG 39.79]
MAERELVEPEESLTPEIISCLQERIKNKNCQASSIKCCIISILATLVD